MAKHKCPACKKQFDYEQNGWICPYCHFIVSGSAESNVMEQEQAEQRNREFQREKHRSDAARDIKWYLKKRLIGSGITILVVFVLLLGIGIGMKVPELIELKNKTQESREITQLDARMNENIHIESFNIKITEAFTVHCDELPEPKSGSYLAVKYEIRGRNRENAAQKLSDTAWAGLHSLESDAYLLPLYISDVVGSNKTASVLTDAGVTDLLDNEEGILLFLVTDDSRQSYELCLFSGEENGFNQYNTLVSERYNIPLKIEKQAGDILS